MTEHNIYTLSNTSSTKLTPGSIHSGFDITIQNNNAAGYVYVGGANVTTSSYGFRILPNHSISFELPSEDHLYLIASTSGITAAVITIGLESQH